MEDIQIFGTGSGLLLSLPAVVAVLPIPAVQILALLVPVLPGTYCLF